jgi:LysR family transcriptional regulator, regulator for genes of the gallate degradation pathway
MQTSPKVPNLRHLRMVQVIGKLGGVSSASRELSTSQPAVTQAVANLEAELGTPIFDRRANGTFPTQAGQQLLLRLDRFFSILDTAIHEVMSRGDCTPCRQPRPVERLVTCTQIRSLIVTSEPARLATQAAEMGLSPSSLFRSARTLERVIGRPLFDRSAQGPIPNRTALNLVRDFRRAICEYEFALGEICLLGGQERLEIVIGALPMAGTFELADAVRRFMAECPAAKVRIVSGDYHGLLDDLNNCRIDMIFGVLRKPAWATEIEEELLYHDSYCIAVRPGHPLCRLREIRPEDLLSYDWVVPASGTPRRQRIESLFQGMPRRPRFNLETSSMGTLRALLLGSDMVTVMTRSEMQLDVALGIVASLPCRNLDAIPPKGVTTRTGWLPTSAHESFLNCLRDSTADVHHELPPSRPRIALAN